MYQRPRRPLVLAATAGGGVVLLIVAALLIGAKLFGPGGPASPAVQDTDPAATAQGGTIGSFGVQTTTRQCPAASVPGAGARCPAAPECWNGIVETEGVIADSALPCDGPHTWQTFAIAIMPADVASFNANTVGASPIVRAVCSYRVLLRSRIGKARLIPRGQWMIQVVPPDEAAYDSGVRTYRCFAAVSLNGARTSQFGR